MADEKLRNLRRAAEMSDAPEDWRAYRQYHCRTIDGHSPGYIDAEGGYMACQRCDERLSTRFVVTAPRSGVFFLEEKTTGIRVYSYVSFNVAAAMAARLNLLPAEEQDWEMPYCSVDGCRKPYVWIGDGRGARCEDHD